MSWDFQRASYHTARKEYHCQASDWLLNSGLVEADFDPDVWQDIQKAKQENFRILPGARYLKVSGVWEGEWVTFRARPEIHDICMEYELYQE